MSNDLILFYESHFYNFLEKFQIRWHGPYCVVEGFFNRLVQLKDFLDHQFITQINENQLQLYYT